MVLLPPQQRKILDYILVGNSRQCVSAEDRCEDSRDAVEKHFFVEERMVPFAWRRVYISSMYLLPKEQKDDCASLLFVLHLVRTRWVNGGIR